jgi:nicotinamide-nucleotide amidase
MYTDNTLSSLQKALQNRLEAIHLYCTKHKQTLAVAESVTSGCIQLLLSTAKGAQEFFQGGITVYNCAQKAIHLEIEPINASSCNGVDPNIAIQMAKNVCSLFRAQIGIGITGYATKVPEEDINELFAYVAIVRNGELVHKSKLTPTMEGIEAQWEYADAVIRTFSELLADTPS